MEKTINISRIRTGLYVALKVLEDPRLMDKRVIPTIQAALDEIDKMDFPVISIEHPE